MPYPTRLGQLTIEEDAAILETLLDLGSAGGDFGSIGEHVLPSADCTYTLGDYNHRWDNLWVCDAVIFGDPDIYDEPDSYIWVTNGAGYTQLLMRAEEISGYGDITLQAYGSSGDTSYLSIESEGGGNSAEFVVKVGAGRSGSPQYELYETYCTFTVANMRLAGGLNLTTPGFSAFIDGPALGMYWRDSDPNKPVLNGESAVWLSDGTASGDAGDLMVEIRAASTTKTFTLIDFSEGVVGGGTNGYLEEYLYHDGDLDTYLRFRDDRLSLAAGAIEFLDYTEAADDTLTLIVGGLTILEVVDTAASQDTVHWNSADADVDFQWDTVGGAGALFIQGSDGYVGAGNVGPDSQLHVTQAGAAAAVPVLHLEQDDVSEEFIRFTGQAASTVLTQSLVDDGDVTTPTLVGWFKIDVQDEGDQITDGVYWVPFYSLA
jgi:hypothetical protein